MAPQEKSLLRYEAPVDIVAEMFDKCAQKKDDAGINSRDFTISTITQSGHL